MESEKIIKSTGATSKPEFGISIILKHYYSAASQNRAKKQ
jgi:hypothetical protein